MTRRFAIAWAGIAPLMSSEAEAQTAAPVKLGIDLFSIRSQGWTPFQYLDCCAQQGARWCIFRRSALLEIWSPST